MTDPPTAGQAADTAAPWPDERAFAGAFRPQGQAGTLFAPPEAIAPVPAAEPAAWARAGAGGPAVRLAAALRDEADFGTPFLLWPVAMGAGAAWWFSAPREPSLALILVVALAALVAAWRFADARIGLPARLVLCLALGALAAAAETRRADTVMMGSQVTTRIAARLIHAERVAGGRTRMWLAIEATNQPVLAHPPERVRLTARGDFSAVPAGARVAGLVRLFALRGPVQPGGHDFAFDAYFAGFGATGFFLGKPVISQAQAPPETAAERIDRARAALTARIAGAVGDGTGDIVAALVTGIRGALTEADSEALRRSGLAHVMSISGLHLALVVGAVLAIIRLGFALLPTFTDRHPVRKWAAGAAIAVAVAYCIISGAEVATLRSTIMIVVMLAAVLLDRPAVTMRNLAIAALIIIVLHPHEVLGPSFQMSFAATAALIAAYRVWQSRPDAAMPPDRMTGAIAVLLGGWRLLKGAAVATIVSSTVAGLATLPFGAFHFERVAPWGTAANLLAFPFISLIVMPALLAGTAALPIGLDGPFWRLAGWGVDRMMDVAHWTASWPGPDATGRVPSEAILLCTAGLLLLVLPATRLRLVGLAPLAISGLIMANAAPPAALIAEDATLVAITGQGGLALSGGDSDAFIVRDWLRLARATRAIPPEAAADAAAPDEAPSWPGGFSCGDGLCLGRLAGGAVLAHVSSAEAEARVCATADIIVEAAAFAEVPCPRHPAVITAGMLARHGTAMLMRDDSKAPAPRRSDARSRKAPPTAAKGHAILWAYPPENGQPQRPWQTHRKFSRAARDIVAAPRDPSLWREANPRLILHR